MPTGGKLPPHRVPSLITRVCNSKIKKSDRKAIEERKAAARQKEEGKKKAGKGGVEQGNEKGGWVSHLRPRGTMVYSLC